MAVAWKILEVAAARAIRVVVVVAGSVVTVEEARTVVEVFALGVMVVLVLMLAMGVAVEDNAVRCKTVAMTVVVAMWCLWLV